MHIGLCAVIRLNMVGLVLSYILYFRNDKDKTALFLAAETGWRKSCNILLEAGVDVSVRDNTEVRSRSDFASGRNLQ